MKTQPSVLELKKVSYGVLCVKEIHESSAPRIVLRASCSLPVLSSAVVQVVKKRRANFHSLHINPSHGMHAHSS